MALKGFVLSKMNIFGRSLQATNSLTDFLNIQSLSDNYSVISRWKVGDLVIILLKIETLRTEVDTL